MKIPVAVHVHSDWSYDGSSSLRQIAELFLSRGFRAVLVSEHDRGFDAAKAERHREACLRASTDEILLVPGFEYSDPENVVHLTCWGKMPFLGMDRESTEIIQRVADLGGFSVFAHPTRKAAWRKYSERWTEHLGAIELWNRKTDGWAPSGEGMALIEQYELPAMAALDYHTKRQLFPLRAWIDVNGQVSEEVLTESLRAGRFHCEAFGKRLESFAKPGQRLTLSLLEWMRRSAAALVRAAIGRRRENSLNSSNRHSAAA